MYSITIHSLHIDLPTTRKAMDVQHHHQVTWCKGPRMHLVFKPPLVSFTIVKVSAWRFNTLSSRLVSRHLLNPCTYIDEHATQDALKSTASKANMDSHASIGRMHQETQPNAHARSFQKSPLAKTNSRKTHSLTFTVSKNCHIVANLHPSSFPTLYQPVNPSITPYFVQKSKDQEKFGSSIHPAPNLPARRPTQKQEDSYQHRPAFHFSK